MEHRVYKKKAITFGEFDRLRRNARREDKLEYYGEEDVPCTERKKFTEYVIKMQEAGMVIKEKDTEIILNTIALHEDFANPRILKFLIKNALTIGRLDGAEKTIIDLMSQLRGTKYYKPLYEYKKWVTDKKLLNRVKDLKKEGLSSEAIASKLSLTSAEVVVLLRDEEKEVDFFAEDKDR